jgi:hypothetical protein
VISRDTSDTGIDNKPLISCPKNLATQEGLLGLLKSKILLTGKNNLNTLMFPENLGCNDSRRIPEKMVGSDL